MNATLQSRSCPGCNGQQQSSRGKKNGYDILVCDDCGTIFTRDEPTINAQDDYGDYYSESNLKVPDFVHTRVGEIVDGFSRFKSNNRFLDVGFGAGNMLEAARDRGWDTFGLEVSAPAVEQAVLKGFNVVKGTLIEAKYPDQYFDVITASEIIEHLPEPETDLREIARILRPGGIFWATTPSAKGISFRATGIAWTIVCPPEHVQLFSPAAIRKMLTRAGFSSVKLQTHGFNPAELLEFIRNKFRGTANPNFGRVETGYALNEALTRSPVRKKVKTAINSTLDLLGLGDSIKIFARR